MIWRMTRQDTPSNKQHLLKALGEPRAEACRASGSIRIEGPLYPALEMFKRSVDAIAVLLTGSRTYFWAGPSSGNDAERERDAHERRERKAELEREAERFRRAD